jgi:hypothetical protein
MRGKHYLWSDGQLLHIWVADGDDGWNDSGWAATTQPRTTKTKPRRAGNKCPSGVGIPEKIMDEFVVMRLAELVAEGRAETAIRRACKRHAGNVGCWELAANAAQLCAGLAALKPKWKRARQARTQ